MVIVIVFLTDRFFIEVCETEKLVDVVHGFEVPPARDVLDFHADRRALPAGGPSVLLVDDLATRLSP